MDTEGLKRQVVYIFMRMEMCERAQPCPLPSFANPQDKASSYPWILFHLRVGLIYSEVYAW